MYVMSANNHICYRLFVLYILLVFSQISFSDTYFFYIQLKDKSNSPFSLETPTEYLSERSIQRRFEQNIAIDSTDLPVNPDYITSIELQGVQVHTVSKWMNGITVLMGDSGLMSEVRNLPFVQFVEYTGKMTTNPLQAPRRSKFLEEGLEYGAAYLHTNQLKGQALHDRGYTGKDIYIALLDAGYQYVDENIAFDSLRLQNRLLGTKNIAVPHADVFAEHYHGSNVLSTMAANIPGQYVGAAPHASYLLIQTEYNPAEYPFEVDFWVSGLEYADSVGVDVVNSSLGYSEFDDSALDYAYSDMDGMTIRCSRAAYLASRKGIIVCSSAGNEGSNSWRNITSPADAQGIMTVGAVDVLGAIAPFSSFGPTADNRVKPDVCATGWGTALVNRLGNIVTSSGTSYSSPIMAGFLACYLQYCKENLPFAYSVDMILENVISSADRFENPHEQYGYGIPNFEAVLYCTLASSAIPKVNADFAHIYFDQSSKLLQVNVLDADETMLLKVYDLAGMLMSNYICQQELTNIPLHDLAPGIYFIHANRKKEVQIVKILIP